MIFSITLVENSGKITTRVFDGTSVNLGRSASNDVRPDPLIHNQVSRHHGRIEVSGGAVHFVDLHSTQGSYLGTHRIEGRQQLRLGDLITLGKDGPRVHVAWPMERVTGKEGTHYRRPSGSPAFPLAFSEGFLHRFDHYTRIAIGGFGEVWRTVERGNAKTPLAIKLMHPSLLAPDALTEDDREALVARFSREARITHLLSQSGAPSIVPVHDFGDDPQRDFIYIIMEHIQGYSLDKLIRPQTLLPTGRVCRYLRDIARGLDAAHNFRWTNEAGRSSRGVIHRDIKPNNLLIEEKTDKGWIVDFGVAGIQEGGDRLTATNITIGTHHFLPPEALEQSLYNEATDLWGFNMTLFVTLSGGRFPFPLDMKSEVIRARYRESQIPLTTFRADVPQPLADAIHRSLSPKPADRVQTAGEWIEILEKHAV